MKPGDGKVNDRDETVLVGHVVKPHGLRGDVIVEALSDVEGRFDVGRQVLLEGPGGRLDPRVISVLGGHKGRLLVRFEKIGDRDEALAIRGHQIRVRLEDVPPAPDGEFYYFELIDCLCRDAEAGDLGKVEAVVEDGGGLLLEVMREGNKVLVPFVKSYVKEVDIESGVIDLELPPGLLETCESRF